MNAFQIVNLPPWGTVWSNEDASKVEAESLRVEGRAGQVDSERLTKKKNEKSIADNE